MNLPDGLTSEIRREMKLKKKPDKGALFLAVVFEYFLFIVLAGFDFANMYAFVITTHVLYISLIVYLVLSSKIARLKNNFSQVLPYFTFLFFMPMQGFITTYDLFNGSPPLYTIVIPLVTLGTLLQITWQRVASKAGAAFFYLYLISMVIISWGMVNIIAHAYPISTHGTYLCNFLRWWYPLVAYTGTLPYLILGYKKGVIKNAIFAFVVFTIFSINIGETWTIISYSANIDSCMGNTDTILTILITLTGAAVGGTRTNLQNSPLN